MLSSVLAGSANQDPRGNHAASQARNPWVGPCLEPGTEALRSGPPRTKPGPPSADAPTDLRAVKISASGVELRWKDHAEGEMAFIVQRGTGAECTDFENAIGQPGQDLSSAVEPNVQPGMTYRYRVYAVRPTPQGPQGTGVSKV